MSKEPTVSEYFGKNIRLIRANKHLSALALSLLIPIDQTYLSDIERGRNKVIGKDILNSISKALGVSLEDLNKQWIVTIKEE